MATFTQNQIEQMWELFNLEREELHTGSALRNCLTQTEQDDATHGTTIVEMVQALLVEITAIEADIQETGSETSTKRIRIDQHYEQEFKDSADVLTRPFSLKSQKKERIATLIRLLEYISTGSAQYARVNAVGGHYGRHYHH